MAIAVRADIFPSNINFSYPGGQNARLENVRAIVTSDRIVVFQDTPAGPSPVYSERLAAYEPDTTNPGSAFYVVTDSGVQVKSELGKGCGCGSRLRSFNPFSTISAIEASPAMAAPSAESTMSTV